MSDMNNQISELIDRHMSTLKTNGKQVSMAMRAIPADVKTAQSVAHMIKGASGSIGFRELSEAAMDLEKHLKSLIASDEAPTNQSYSLLDRFEEISNNLKPTDSSLYQV